MQTHFATVSREGIAAMEPQIRPYVRRTPQLDLDGILLKLESMQVSGFVQSAWRVRESRHARDSACRRGRRFRRQSRRGGCVRGNATRFRRAESTFRIFRRRQKSSAFARPAPSWSLSRVCIPMRYACSIADAADARRDGWFTPSIKWRRFWVPARSAKNWKRRGPVRHRAGTGRRRWTDRRHKRVVRRARAHRRRRTRGRADTGLGAARRPTGASTNRQHRQRFAGCRSARRADLSDRPSALSSA